MSDIFTEQGKMSLPDHLGELRGRLIKIIAILIAGTTIAAVYSKETFSFIQRPILKALPDSQTFIALSPLEAWVVYLKLAFVTSLFVTAPAWFYQIWAFVAPALAKNERRAIVLAAFASAICFILGGAFGYFLILPTGFHYLAAVYDKTDIALYPQMQWYFSFILRALFAFGVVFETPLVLAMLSRFGIVPVSKMKRARRYVIVGIFVFAAVITPGPDVFSQIAVAIPLILFYELGIIAAVVMERKRYVKAASDNA